MSDTKNLPFKIDTQNELSNWRAETFFSKEPETLAWLKEFAAREIPPLLLDIGANIGLYSLFYLSLKSTTETISCEPFSENIRLLEKNLEMNNFGTRAEIVKEPLSSVVELGYAEISDTRPGGSGYVYKKFSGKEVTGPPTNASNIDSILSTESRRVIIKIDTDGSDFGILCGAAKSLKHGNIDSILIESSEHVQERIKIFLKKFGLIPDQRFNSMDNHSDARRINTGKTERNRVYSKI